MPITYSASKKKLFHSWDRFMLPYPFSRVVFLWGDPVFVTKDLRGEDLEKKRQELEASLIALTETADRMACGD